MPERVANRRSESPKLDMRAATSTSLRYRGLRSHTSA